jgi:hypothetical protein
VNRSIDAVRRALRWLRQLICFHDIDQHMHVGKGEHPDHYATDICSRCGKVTLKYYVG